MSNFFVALAVFVITVVGALFTVPYFIDWNGYRGVFEEEASRLLGREVRVGGAVNLHLLPTPYFRFEKVRIADTSVNLEEPFFRTESLTIKLAVPPLLRGAVEANEIEFQRPVLRLALDEKGGWNWQSFVQALSNAPYLPTNVVLTSLKIKDGVLAVHGANGAERTRIEGLDGELSSPALDGPYRFRGTFGAAGAEREIRLSTAKSEGDGSVRFKTSLRLADAGSSYVLDGRLLDLMGKPRLDGELVARLPVSSIWPTGQHVAAPAHGKSMIAPEAAKPDSGEAGFDLKAAVVADAAGATLNDVALSFEQGGRLQLLSGRVKAAWREALAVDMALDSRWLDLDNIAGVSEGSSPLESIVPLAIRLRDLLPTEGRSRASFTVDQANIARETVSNLRLTLARSGDKLEIEELKLGMPGGSRGELQGTVSGPANAATFNGAASLRGASTVRFLGWARGMPFPPDTKGDGAFGLRAQVSIASGRVQLREVVGDLSGTAVYGTAQYRWDGRPELSLAIEGPQIDVRPFMPEGTSLQDIFNAVHLSPGELSVPGAKAGAGTPQTDMLVRINAGQLIATGRVFRDVALALDLRGGNLRLPFLRLSGDEGYNLELEGEVDDVSGRPKGSIRALATAENLQGIPPLIELLGIPPTLRPGEARLQGVAPLRVAGAMVFGGRTATSTDFSIDGEANGSSIKGSARLDGSAAGWRKGQADVTATLEGADAGRIVASLLGSGGKSSGGEGARPGRILIKATGLPGDGLATIATVESGNLALGYRGQIAATHDGNRLAGELEIKGADGAGIAALAGLAPPLRLDNVPVSGTVSFKTGDGLLDVERLTLSLGDTEVRGKIALAPAGERRRITAQLSVGELSVARLLGPILDQRFAVAGAVEAALSGQQSLWPDDSFDAGMFDGFEGTIKLDASRLVLANGVGLGGATLDVGLEPGKLEVKELAGEGLGGKFSTRFTLLKVPGSAQLAGTAAFEGTLEAVAAARNGGAPRATGPFKGTLQFASRGGSPRALLAALEGKANVELGEARIANLWPGAVGAAVEAGIKVEADRVGATLRERLAAALQEGQLQVGPASLALDIAEGQLRSKPIVVETDQGRATGSVNLDLRSLAFASDWRLERKRANDKIDEKAALPAVSIQYRGQASNLSALEARIDTGSLERELTTRKMEIDLEELERLRQADELRRRSELERQRQQPDLRVPDSRLPGPVPLPKGSTLSPG